MSPEPTKPREQPRSAAQ